MATSSPFDPNKVDPEYYSNDASQLQSSDNDVVEEGIENSLENKYSEEDSPVWDADADAIAREPEAKMISDEAAEKRMEVAENPSDDALFHRADATYLEKGDDPGKGYDPHNVGYDKKDE